MNDIDFDRVGQNTFCNCVDNLQDRGKSETPKKVGDRNVYRTEESEEQEEEVEGEVLGGAGDEVSVMPFVYPRVTVSVSSLGSF